jgi:hypothetical protein
MESLPTNSSSESLLNLPGVVLAADSKPCKSCYGTFCNRPASSLLREQLPTLLDELSIRVVNATIDYNPRVETLASSWERVTNDLDSLHARLGALPDISFILSAIEVREATSTQRRSKPSSVALPLRDDIYTRRKDRDTLEDILSRQELDEDRRRQLLSDFDETNHFVLTRTLTANGRSLLLDAATHFPIHATVDGTYYVEEVVYPDTDIGTSVEGYPHLQVVIGYMNINGTYRDTGSLAVLLQRISTDVQVGERNGRGRKIKASDPVAIIGHALKNCRHTAVNDALGTRLKYHIVLNLVRAAPRLIEFFQDLVSRKCPATLINLPNTATPSQLSLLASSSPVTPKFGETALQQAYSRVRYYMERESMALFKGRVYQRIAGSKMAWASWPIAVIASDDPVELLVGSMCSFNNFMVVEYRTDIERMMRSKTQNVFPRLHLDHQWIELADCFVFAGTGIVTATNTQHACFYYAPELKRSDLRQPDVMRPTELLETVSSRLAPDQVEALLASLYKLYIPRANNNPTLHLLLDLNVLREVRTLLTQTAHTSVFDSVLASIGANCVLAISGERRFESITDILLLKLLDRPCSSSLPITAQVGVAFDRRKVQRLEVRCETPGGNCNIYLDSVHIIIDKLDSRARARLLVWLIFNHFGTLRDTIELDALTEYNNWALQHPEFIHHSHTFE